MVYVEYKFKYEGYPLEEIKNVPDVKKIRLFVNGYLKYSIEDFDEFIFKDLFEYRKTYKAHLIIV